MLSAYTSAYTYRLLLKQCFICYSFQKITKRHSLRQKQTWNMLKIDEIRVESTWNNWMNQLMYSGPIEFTIIWNRCCISSKWYHLYHIWLRWIRLFGRRKASTLHIRWYFIAIYFVTNWFCLGHKIFFFLCCRKISLIIFGWNVVKQRIYQNYCSWDKITSMILLGEQDTCILWELVNHDESALNWLFDEAWM